MLFCSNCGQHYRNVSSWKSFACLWVNSHQPLGFCQHFILRRSITMSGTVRWAKLLCNVIFPSSLEPNTNCRTTKGWRDVFPWSRSWFFFVRHYVNRASGKFFWTNNFDWRLRRQPPWPEKTKKDSWITPQVRYYLTRELFRCFLRPVGVTTLYKTCLHNFWW